MRSIKRSMDVLGAASGLVVAAPVTAVIAVAIRAESAGPVFFRQERIGRDGKPFQMVKFRSMLRLEDSYDKRGVALENYDRVTRVGRVLRASSLDEMPQLVNILNGEMSLVGPRPTLRYQVERYDHRQWGRLKVRPGLTGLAQVSGRNSLLWDEKISLDLEYVSNVSFLRDLKIVLRTVYVVLRRESVAFSSYDSLSEHEGGYGVDI